jgi:hypothetical protein
MRLSLSLCALKNVNPDGYVSAKRNRGVEGSSSSACERPPVVLFACRHCSRHVMFSDTVQGMLMFSQGCTCYEGSTTHVCTYLPATTRGCITGTCTSATLRTALAKEGLCPAHSFRKSTMVWD